MNKVNISESKYSTPQELRIETFISSMRYIDFGNGGVPSKLQDYILRDKKAIEDIHYDNATVYILPKSQQTAKYLLDVCLGDKDLSDEYPNALADEIGWLKVGDRYWLRLWFD